MMSPASDAGLLGRAVLEDADDERPAVVGQRRSGRRSRRTSPDSSSVRAAALLGGQERGVAGVADGLGHAVDRPVGQGPVVEVRAADVLLVERVPCLTDEVELLCGRAA